MVRTFFSSLDSAPITILLIHRPVRTVVAVHGTRITVRAETVIYHKLILPCYAKIHATSSRLCTGVRTSEGQVLPIASGSWGLNNHFRYLHTIRATPSGIRFVTGHPCLAIVITGICTRTTRFGIGSTGCAGYLVRFFGSAFIPLEIRSPCTGCRQRNRLTGKG